MNIKLALAASLFVAIPVAVYAQQNGSPGQAPKPTMADIKNLFKQSTATRPSSEPIARWAK